MALLWVERFGGHYQQSDIATHFPFSNVDNWQSRNATGGRDGGPCMEIPSSNSNHAMVCRPPAGQQTGTGILGIVFRQGPNFVINPFYGLVNVYDTDYSANQLSLGLVSAADPRLCVRRGRNDGTIIASGTTTLVVNSWYVAELKFVLHPSAGSVHLKLNSLDEIHTSGGPVTGLNTRGGASNNWHQIVWNMIGNSGFRWESAWILNDSGGSTAAKDFLGDCQAVCLMPTAESGTIGFTPSTGTDNALTVDEAPKNDDTDYNEATSTVEDLLEFADIPAGLSGKVIHGWQMATLARQTTTGLAQMRQRFRTNLGTMVNGPTVALAQSSSYTEWGNTISEVNPDTSAKYTESELNGSQIGYQKMA